MDNEGSTDYIIEEVEYVDYGDVDDGVEIIEIDALQKAKPSTSKDALRQTTARNNDSMDEDNLIQELIGGEINLSEYDRDGVENISDCDTDDSDSESSPQVNAAKTSAQVRRLPSASQSFDNELDKSRKDAMRGLLQGRDELRDGRQRRRCVLPAALQGKILFYTSNWLSPQFNCQRIELQV